MSVMVQGKEAGLIFELHPKTAKEFEINGASALFDIDVNKFFDAKKADNEFVELQKFPEVPFEISVLADRFTYANDICRIIENSNQKFIKSVDVISIYEGEQIEEGKKSVSIKIIFAAKDKTLESQEIEQMQKKIIADLEKKNFYLR